MTYMLISGAINDSCLNSILAVRENPYELENSAQKFVEQNPGTEVHIFKWERGFSSRPSVVTERLWHSGYIPPKIPQAPETIDEPLAEQELQHDSAN